MTLTRMPSYIIFDYLSFLTNYKLTSNTAIHHGHVSGVSKFPITVALGSNPLYRCLTELVPRTADVHSSVYVRIGNQTIRFASLTAPRGPQGTPLGTVGVQFGPIIHSFDGDLVFVRAF
jgi:hypothetical protein